MSLPSAMTASGTFTAVQSTPVDIYVPGENPVTFFRAINISTNSSQGWGRLSSAQENEWFWCRAMAQDTAKGILQSSDASNPAMIARLISSDGIRTYDSFNPPTYAALTATAITAANPAVVSMANTGTIAVGDMVRLTGVTGMQQIAGMDFQVRAVTTNVSITLMFDASGFAAPATAAQVTKFIPSRFYPRYRWINSISQATQAVVTFSANNDFTPGEFVRFRVPSISGGTTMTQINNKSARILSVTNSSTASSITLDLDTSGYSAFAFPTSAQSAAGNGGYAVCFPDGAGIVPDSSDTSLVQQPPGTQLRAAFDNRNRYVVHMGASLFAAANSAGLWYWEASTNDLYNGS